MDKYPVHHIHSGPRDDEVLADHEFDLFQAKCEKHQLIILRKTVVCSAGQSRNSSMNKLMKRYWLAIKRKHGTKFANWLHKSGKMEWFFDCAVGFVYTRKLLDFALEKLTQIEPELTQHERMRTY